MELKVQKNVSLKQFCTYKTGGNALYFSSARSYEELFYLREFAKIQNIPYMILGGGSNVLFADEGYPGLVIYNQMKKIHFQGEIVTAESGASLSQLILLAAQNNLGGLSGLINVPGTMGGAVYGNAGIPDVYLSDVLMQGVILPENQSQPMVVNADYFNFGYRHSRLKESKDILISATLKLRFEPMIKIKAEINLYSKERALKQPAGFSCGSFFKNPDQFPSAGWLIEQAGCKGMKIGGALVSPKHANFILNTGEATSRDIITLTVRVHQIVKEKFNVSLQPEVQIVPQSPFSAD